ncbi:MAG: magnesium transporter CorA family protein [Actinomycetota bacterium]
MFVRTMDSEGRIVDDADGHDVRPPDGGWLWIDIRIEARPEDAVDLSARLGLDALAVRDAIEDHDLPKVDDFGDHLLMIVHGLRTDDVATYEIDCFLTAGRQVITIHQGRSPSIDALWAVAPSHPEILEGTPGELVARLADVATRRFLGVLDAFDDRIDDLVAAALEADPALIGEVTAVRADLREVRRVIQPQREVFDALRTTSSPLIGEGGRRRFADAFDVAARISAGVETARGALAETIDAYRGAEAREATEVGRVLTVYAAIMLPLTVIGGFFGMNFPGMPGTDSDRGWIWVTVLMGLVTVGSLLVFIRVGWIRPASRHGLGRGLMDAARRPVTLAGALFVRSSGARRPPRP